MSFDFKSMSKWFYAFVGAAVLLIAAIIVAIVLGVTLGANAAAPLTEGPETGAYYYDVAGGEVTLSLHGGNKFTINGPGYNKSGEYTVNGSDISFDFFRDEDGTASAQLNGEVLTFVKDGITTEYLKKILYTVSFNTAGGSSLEAVTVVNGKTLTPPAQPTKEGSVFLGWYAEEALKTPFSFATTAIATDTVLYAKWAETGDSEEYVLTLVAGNGADAESIATIGGKLAFGADYTAPTRDGYTFGGWYVSMTEDADKLSYEVKEGDSFSADTTLYAVWYEASATVSAPLLSVGNTAITWNNVNDVNVTYTLKITNEADGSVLFEGGVSGVAKAFNFLNENAGEYKIELTATKASESATAVRYYTNKGLDRVYKFNVVDGKVLVFGAVENAEKYLITVDCGNLEHNHTNFDNGNSTVFNFANCSMQAGGIKFTVTAVATGYESSVSNTYVYVKNLDSVSGLTYDATTGAFTWNQVDSAMKYLVTVTVGENTYTFDNGTKTSFSVQGYTGEINVAVVPVTDGYNSPAASTANVTKTKLATPENISISGVTVTWNAVENATGYIVSVNGATYNVDEASFSLMTEGIKLSTGNSYAITVTAVSNVAGIEASYESKAVTSKYLEMSGNVKYSANTVSWDAAIGSTSYEVMVNDAEPFVVEGTSAKVVLTKAGKNVIGVRTADLGDSKWNTVEVYAYEVKYISRSLSYSDVTEYVAIGDTMLLPSGYEMLGYDFTGWYNAPAGAEGNGAKYSDTAFVGNGDITLYANWTPKTYGITIYVDDTVTNLTNESVMNATYTKDYYMTPAVSSDGTRGGFVGWYTLPGGAGVQLTDGNGYSVAPYSYTDNIVAYPFFDTEVLSYTMKADGTFAAAKGRNINNVTTVRVPTTYKGVEVTSILENAFSSCTTITTIEIPDTIQLIGTGAFNGCSSLTAINIYEVEGNNGEKFYSSYDGALIYFDAPSNTRYLEFFPRAKTGIYTIPETVENIRTNAFIYSNVEHLIVSKNVKYIAEKAFNSCRSLRTLEFEYGGTTALTIENGAFVACTTIENIMLPARASSFDYKQLRDFTALKSISVEEGSTAYSSVNGMLTDSTKAIIKLCPVAYDQAVDFAPGTIEIEADAFANVVAIESITIPWYMNKIGNGAFDGCIGINTVTVSGGRNNPLTIGEGAFANCPALTSVVFEGNSNGTSDSGATTIGKNAFAANEALTTITVNAGANVGMIGESAFNGCTALDTLAFNDNAVISNIGDYAFANTAIETLVIHPSTETVGNYAFAGCKALSSMSFAPDGKDIDFGEYVFSECTRLVTINIPANVTNLDGSAFNGCDAIKDIIVDPANKNLKSVDGILYDYNITSLKFYPRGKDGDLSKLPWNTLTHIESTVFRNNPKIQRVDIGANIVSIGESAFENCINLSEVNFNSAITEMSIGAGAFKKCVALEGISLPATTIAIGAEAFYMSELKAITIPASVTTIGNYAFAYTKLESVELSASLTSVGDGAFASCTYLTTVTIAANGPDLTLGTIENADSNAGVFAKTALSSITIPDRVTIIGSYAFADVTTLTTFAVSENSKITEIGAYAFSNTAFTTMPKLSKLTTIGDYAFYGAKIENITIAKSVTLIGASAFESSKLVNVEFEMGGTLDLEIKGMAFGKTTFTTITLPARLVKLHEVIVINKVASKYFEIDGAYYVFDGNTKLENINVEKGGSVFASFSGVLCYVDENGVASDLLYCPPGKTGALEIPKEITNIRNHAFHGTSLTSVTFEEYDKTDTEHYGKPLLEVGLNTTNTDNRIYVFYGDKLESISFPSHLKALNAYAVTSKANVTTLTTITFNPDSEVALNESCMAGNGGLKSMVFPKVTAFGAKVLSNAYALESVTFAPGSTFTSIGDNAFSINSGKANYLTTITIPRLVESLGATSFQNRTALAEVKFEEGSELLSIGNLAFQSTALTTFTFPPKVTTINNRVFNLCPNLTEINVPVGVSAFLWHASGNLSQATLTIFGDCPSLVAINVDEFNPNFVSVDGVVYDKAMSTVVVYPQAKPIDEYVMPDSVVALGNMSFRFFKGTSITLGKNVKSVGNYAFDGSANLTSIVFPAALETMGTYVFQNCKALKSVVFEPGCALTTIGQRAFYNCTSLESIDLPDNVATYGDYMFNGCSSLKSVTLSAAATAINASMFYNCTSLESIALQEGIKTIGNSAFSFASSLKSITIPSTVTSMGTGVFSSCTALTSVEFAPIAQLKSIGNNSFQKTAIESITIPESVTTLGTALFSGVTTLKSVDIKANVTTLPKQLFNGCIALESVTIPASVTSIADAVFSGCSSLVEVTIPAGVTGIGNGAFANCTSLTSVVFEGDALETIGNSTTAATTVFQNTTSLESITIPASVKTIGHSAFENSAISEIIFEGNNLEAVGPYAFRNCDNLVTAQLPASVTAIMDGAFYGCAKLESVNLQFGLEMIGSYAFGECPKINNILIPASVEELGSNPFLDCASLSNFGLDQDNINFRFINGVLYDKDMYTLIYYSATNMDEVYVVPENVMEIGVGAFSGAKLKRIEYPERFNYIPDYAFKNCALLESIVIPKSIESIGNYAFDGCASLVSVDIPNSVNSMGDYVFANCTSLATVNYEERKVNITIGQYTFLNCENITYLAIPTDYVANFSVGMFSGTGVVNVELPNHLMIEVDRVFENCKSLERVTFSDDYGAQKLGAYVFSGCSSLKSFKMPAMLATTGIYSFANCTSLESVEFNEEMYIIDDYSFYNCTSLKSVSINTWYLWMISGHAFAGCTSLESVELSNLSEVYSYAFENCTNLKSFTVTDPSLETIYPNAFENCTGLTELHLYADVLYGLDATAFNGWTAEQTIYIHGLESLEAAAMKYGKWINTCTVTIVVLPE